MIRSLAYALELCAQNIYQISLDNIFTYRLNTPQKLHAYHQQMKELKKLYYTYLTNFINIIRQMGFNNPIEICALFRYCLEKGYLSNGGQFTFENIFPDISNIEGVHVIEGHGVCRHIAPMLRDILNLLNIPSAILTLYARELTNVNVDFSDDKSNVAPEKIIRLLGRLNITSEQIALISEECNNFTNYLEIRALYEEYDTPIGNHVITLASYNNIGYLLDASKNGFYIYHKEEDYLQSYRVLGHIIPEEIKWDNLRCPKRVESILKLPNIPLNEAYDLSDNTLMKCELHQDILQNFNYENEELITEISNQTRKLIQTK